MDKKATNFNDGILEFTRLLLIEYDFDNAYKKLKEFIKDLKDDFFLSHKID